MRKHISAIIAVLVVLILTLCGCGNQVKSSPEVLQKYYEEMMENYFEYISSTTYGISTSVAREIAETETAALEKFEEMSVPEEYDFHHRVLLAAAEKEREWIKVLRDYADGVIDYEGIYEKQMEMRPDGRSEFTTRCLNIIAELNHNPGVKPTEKGQMLEMLSKL